MFPQIAYHSLTFQIVIMELNTPNVRDNPMPSDIDDLLGPDDDDCTSSDHGEGQMEEKTRPFWSISFCWCSQSLHPYWGRIPNRQPSLMISAIRRNFLE